MDQFKPRSQGEVKERAYSSANDLQALLINERERGNKHRLNYITLKSNLKNAENKIKTLEDGLRKKGADYERELENYQSNLQSLGRENQEKSSLIQKLKYELKRPEEVDLIVLQAKLDTEKAFKDKINTLDSMNKDLQKQILLWKHKNDLHLAEINNLKASNDGKVYELTQGYEAKIKYVEECCNKLFQPTVSASDYENMVEELKLENKSLISRVEHLETCVSNIEKERSSLQQEYDASRRSWSKQTIIHSNNVEDFKSEIVKLKNTITILEKKDAATAIDKSNIESKLNEAELKNVGLQFSLEQYKQRLKMKDSADKIREAEIMLDNKREINSLNKLLRVTRQETISKDAVIGDLRSRVSQMEKELSSTVADYKELTENFAQLSTQHQMLKEKQDNQTGSTPLETPMASQCLQCNRLAEQKEAETVKVDEQFKLIQSLTSDLEAEKLDSLQSSNSLKSLQKTYETVLNDMGRLEVELANLGQQNNELKTQLKDSISQQDRSTRGYEATLVDMRLKHGEEIIHLTRRITDLESALQSQVDMKEELNLAEQKLHTYRKLIRKLRKKLEPSRLGEGQHHKHTNWKIKCHRLQDKLDQITCSQKQFHDILMGISVPLRTDKPCVDLNKNS